MNIVEKLSDEIKIAFESLFSTSPKDVKLEITKKEFKGDYTWVVFPYLKLSGKSPLETGEMIGKYLLENGSLVENFNVIKGFLNISIRATVWNNWLMENFENPDFGFATGTSGNKIVVEYSSPNTNKPLHLGHVRNNVLGWSVAEILKANGHKVIKANLINDRGIHICKSMLAWMKLGHGETPESSGMKGDKLVGKYYVMFNELLKKEIDELIVQGMSEEEAEKNAPCMTEAREMLIKWENENPEIREVWNKMNGWVYEGFDITYKNLGCDFDTIYYESQTYKLGKEIVLQGLKNNIFYQKEDGSIWVDLTSEGLDHKLLLRSDGTSVYMTQDIGTARLKQTENNCNTSVYVVANEQDYHFKALRIIMEKLNEPNAKGIYHLSYGMVELPTGRLKSREGTTVDADDLMDEMVQAAKEKTNELGKTAGLDEGELNNLYHAIGLSALKYFLLRVDPQKKMVFNPEESIELHGNTGPFIQYTYARSRSLLRVYKDKPVYIADAKEMVSAELHLLKHLYRFPETVREAGNLMSPALVAGYAFETAQLYNSLWHDCSILKEEDLSKKNRRIALSVLTSSVIRNALKLLGITPVERM